MKFKNHKQRKAVMAQIKRLKKAGFSDSSAKFMAMKANGDKPRGKLRRIK